MANRELILDVRTPGEYNRGHLQGAFLIPTPLPPLDELQRAKLKENLRRGMAGISRERKVYVYCKKGIRAGIAAEVLEDMGYDVTSLGGVEEGWLAEQLRTRRLKLR